MSHGAITNQQTFGGLTEWLRSSLGMRVRCNSPVGSSPMSSARKDEHSARLFYYLRHGREPTDYRVRVLRFCPTDCADKDPKAQRRGSTHARAARDARLPSTSLRRRQSGCGLRPCPPPEKTPYNDFHFRELILGSMTPRIYCSAEATSRLPDASSAV